MLKDDVDSDRYEAAYDVAVAITESEGVPDEVLGMAATAFFQLNEFDQAERVFGLVKNAGQLSREAQRWMELTPAYKKLWAEEQEARKRDAESNLRKAVELNPDRFDYHLGLAKALMAQRKNSEAVRVLNDAEGLAADNRFKYALHSTRGNAYAYQRKWGEAVDDLEKAKTIKVDPPTLTQLGKAYFALGQNEKAVENFRQSLKLESSNKEVMALMVEALLNMGAKATSDSLKKQYYGDALAQAEALQTAAPENR